MPSSRCGVPVAPHPPILEREQEVTVSGVSGLVAFGKNVILQGNSVGKLNIATFVTLNIRCPVGGGDGGGVVGSSGE
jgi:hypothetical protein